MKYWFDTEFIEDGTTIDLLSIGIVAEDGRELYRENGEADFTKANDWVRAHVFPHMRWAGMQSKAGIAHDVARFIQKGEGVPEIWAYFCSYDWVVFCQLFGRMVDLPDRMPRYCNDLKQLIRMSGNPHVDKLPERVAHDALVDAKWCRDAWEAVMAYRKEKGMT